MRSPHWFRRLVCRIDDHVAPFGWEVLGDDTSACVRCGEPFDAAEQERLRAEMQTLSP